MFCMQKHDIKFKINRGFRTTNFYSSSSHTHPLVIVFCRIITDKILFYVRPWFRRLIAIIDSFELLSCTRYIM